jgi:aryl-alcohol dehydrogenase-like predicted oxidoreductase
MDPKRWRLDGQLALVTGGSAGIGRAIARELGVAPAPLAIAWCLRNPHVSTVLLGASRVEQLLQNLEALALDERMDEGAWKRVEAVTA